MSQCVGWVRWATVSGALLAGHAVVSAAPAIAEDAAGQAPPLAAAASEAADNAEAAAQAQAAYQQALQALEQQQWTQAELLLERVLMFQPEHAEALLQLATLLAQRDRLETAQALIGVLLHDPRTPPAHRRHLQALLDGIESGDVAEMFACGTAAVITPIGQLKGKDFAVGDLNAPAGEVTMGIRKELTDIQYGRLPDRHGWLVKLRD